jgi:1-acyl-sn-glycerol-3-phosphate acyltransferase
VQPSTNPTTTQTRTTKQVDADWWYCWEFARALGLHGRLKIILKADLKKIPVVGWGMRQFEFLFLDRNWQGDKRRLYRCVFFGFCFVCVCV